MGWTWSLSTLSSCQSRANKKHKRLNNCYDLFTVSIFSLVVYFHFFLWLNRCRVRFGVLLRLIICCTTLFLFFVFCVIELLFSFFLGTLQTLCVFNRVFNFFFFWFSVVHDFYDQQFVWSNLHCYWNEHEWFLKKWRRLCFYFDQNLHHLSFWSHLSGSLYIIGTRNSLGCNHSGVSVQFIR